MPERPLTRSVFGLPRRRIADLLRSHPMDYWTVDKVASERRIHRTVAFQHLEALVEAGMLEKTNVKAGRGRPANAYRYAGAMLELSYPPQQTRILATVLARAVERGVRPHKVARRLGAALGGLRVLGTDYKVDGRSVHAVTCIFGAVCPQARDVVCDVHAGLIEGALEKSHVAPEGPDGAGGCRFRVSTA